MSVHPRSMQLPSPPESEPLRQHARVASLGYSRVARDNRPTPPRLLVAVHPPADLIPPGPLRGRTGVDGVLLPLFPTLYVQLAAVAREFGMPSTAGLCLYLHVHDADGLYTPRISDDAWTHLYAHFTDSAAVTSAPSPLPPVVARIEFDVDQQKGRWVHAWLGGQHKHVPPPSTSHHPVDLHDGHIQRLSRPIPLSHLALRQQFSTRDLVERVTSWRAVSGSPKNDSPIEIPSPPPFPPAAAPDDLVVSGSPKQLEIDLNEYAWSISSPGPLTPHSVPDPYPSPVSSVDIGGRAQGSIPLTPSYRTSFGPGSTIYSDVDLTYTRRLLSPDLAARLLEDSPCTPTTATSWGPPSVDDSPYDLHSVISSVDIAARCIEDTPFLPSRPHVTSQESPDSFWIGHAYPVLEIYPACYPHIEVYCPPSAQCSISAASSRQPLVIDKGGAIYPHFNLYPAMLTPSPLASLNLGSYPAILVYLPVYPHITPYPDLPIEHPPHGRISSVRFNQSSRWHQHRLSLPSHSYPAIVIYEPAYPYIIPYPAPSTDIRPSTTVEPELLTRRVANHSSSVYPAIVVYEPVYPNIIPYPGLYAGNTMLPRDNHGITVIVAELARYPSIALYSPVYPNIAPYHEVPADARTSTPVGGALTREWDMFDSWTQATYPVISVYPPAYPLILPYHELPSDVLKQDTDSLYKANDNSLSAYPIISIYKPAYPYIQPYSDRPHDLLLPKASHYDSVVTGKAVIAAHISHYPTVVVYEPVYPFIYPYHELPMDTRTALVVVPSSLPELHRDRFTVESPLLFQHYPYIQPYKAVYPFTVKPYPSKAGVLDGMKHGSIQFEGNLTLSYPFLRIYSSIYPNMELYPALT